jgi:hypothetical protein
MITRIREMTQNTFEYLMNRFFKDTILNEQEMILNESLTYYELRQFITVLFKNTKDSNTKNMLKELIRIITKLEIVDIPLPVIRKQKSKSPEIFK